MQEDICVQETPVMVTPIKPYKMIATRGVVVFPGDTVSFEIIRDKSLAALQKASESGEDIFVVSQKHSSTVKPAPKDIYRVGTLVKILKIVKLPSEAIRVSVLGIKRMEIESYSQISPYFEVQRELHSTSTSFTKNLTVKYLRKSLLQLLHTNRKDF